MHEISYQVVVFLSLGAGCEGHFCTGKERARVQRTTVQPQKLLSSLGILGVPAVNTMQGLLQKYKMCLLQAVRINRVTL